jgi:hypothetical protein
MAYMEEGTAECVGLDLSLAAVCRSQTARCFCVEAQLGKALPSTQQRGSRNGLLLLTCPPFHLRRFLLLSHISLLFRRLRDLLSLLLRGTNLHINLERVGVNRELLKEISCQPQSVHQIFRQTSPWLCIVLTLGSSNLYAKQLLLHVQTVFLM